MLHHQLPWYVGGPVLGLCVIALRLLLNGRLGVTGGIHRRDRQRPAPQPGLRLARLVLRRPRGRRRRLRAHRRRPDFHGYGWLTDTFHGSGQIVIAVLLLAAGVLIGYGAKTAGGCTSGNGLSGTSMLSPASLVATATFFGTAIAVSFLIEAVI